LLSGAELTLPVTPGVTPPLHIFMQALGANQALRAGLLHEERGAAGDLRHFNLAERTPDQMRFTAPDDHTLAPLHGCFGIEKCGLITLQSQ
jgi:hypothetical protein